MNKSELIDALAPRFASRADAERALTAVLDTIEGAVARNDKVTLPGFGTFERRRRASRRVRHPQTGDVVRTSATHVAAFRPGSRLKSRVALGKRGKASLTDVVAGQVAADPAAEAAASVAGQLADAPASKAAKAEKKALKRAKKLAKAEKRAKSAAKDKTPKKDKASKKGKKAKKS